MEKEKIGKELINIMCFIFNPAITEIPEIGKETEMKLREIFTEFFK